MGWTWESASNKLSGDADHTGLWGTLSIARLMVTSQLRGPPTSQCPPLLCSSLGSVSMTQRPWGLQTRILFPFVILGASLMAQLVKNPFAMQETRVQSLGGEDSLEEGIATHSSILAWRIPWTEEPGGLQFMWLQGEGHICLLQRNFRRRQRHPTPVLLPGKSHGRRSLVGCPLWGRTESDTTEAT